MSESFYISQDALGNRAVILCESGYPIRGMLFPYGIESDFASDKSALMEHDVPFGGMEIDTESCISIMMHPYGIFVEDGTIRSDKELTDDEKRYLSPR